MENVMPFGEVLEAAGRLSLEEQETLLDVLHRRVIEQRREELSNDIRQAEQEFQEGHCQSVTPSELMREITA
jgi:acetyl-CoA carboxylase beta subunit